MNLTRFTKSIIFPFVVVVFILCFANGRLPFLWLVSAFVIAYFISNIIHEFAHYAFFKRYGLTIVELSFGVFRIMFIEGQAVLLWTLDRPFDVLCSCKGLRDISSRGRSICLLAGGAVNLAVAIILAVLSLFATTQQAKLLLFVQISACTANAFINIVNPYSTDRKLLCQLNYGGSV